MIQRGYYAWRTRKQGPPCPFYYIPWVQQVITSGNHKPHNRELLGTLLNSPWAKSGTLSSFGRIIQLGDAAIDPLSLFDQQLVWPPSHIQLLIDKRRTQTCCWCFNWSVMYLINVDLNSSILTASNLSTSFFIIFDMLLNSSSHLSTFASHWNKTKQSQRHSTISCKL